MSVLLILHTAMFVLGYGVRRHISLTNYQDLLLASVFCISLEISEFPVVHVFPDSENSSQPNCGNDFVTFLTSKSNDFGDTSPDVEMKKTEHDETSIRGEKERVERRKTNLIPQVKIRLPYTRIKTGLVVHKSHWNLNKVFTSAALESIDKRRRAKYPLSVINVHLPQPMEVTRFQKEPNGSKSQRSNKVGGTEILHKKDIKDIASLPWIILWILQEFRALEVPSNNLFKKSVGPRGLQSPKHEVKKISADHELALVPWQTLWLLQSDKVECSYSGKVLRIGPVLKDIEMSEWLRPNPEESLGNCPVRFRPLVDPYRWLPRNLVETECVCEGSPCARRGRHVCVTVYATRTVYSLRGGKRRLLIAVGCLCAIQKTRLATSVSPKTVD